MANNDYPDCDDYSDNYPRLLRSIVRTVRGIMQGKTNNAYSVTLTANAASTVVSVSQNDIGPYSTILFMPLTANAAAEIGAGGMYVSSITASPNSSSSFTITHANNAQTDRQFRYAIIG